MGRKKKFQFTNPKMFSARVETEDYDKAHFLLEKENKSIQEFVNECVRSYISGTLNTNYGREG